MDWCTLLNAVIYQFRDLFGSHNFALFAAYVWGLILCPHRHTVTGIYLASQPATRYWSLIQFLSRGRWEPEAVVRRLLRVLLASIPERLYVYDQTHAIKTGKKQWGLHFFRNHRYRRGNTNQSKLHWGHQFAGLGILALTATTTYLFPVWVKLLRPGDLAGSGLDAFAAIQAMLPPGLIICDRGFNNRKYFRCFRPRHHLLCRARSNMVFYSLPQPAPRPRRGRKRVYGKRACIRHWRYQPLAIAALHQTVLVAHQIVRTKVCSDPVRLVVVRTRPKPGQPSHYFLVYTTDVTLPVETIVTYYKRRWTFETGIRDAKESFGFDHYQVRSAPAIERSVLLSFVAASLTQLLALPAFRQQQGATLPSLTEGLHELNIHWYHPTRWTLGLIACYLRWKNRQRLFPASIAEEKTLRKNTTPCQAEAA